MVFIALSGARRLLGRRSLCPSRRNLRNRLDSDHFGDCGVGLQFGRRLGRRFHLHLGHISRWAWIGHHPRQRELRTSQFHCLFVCAAWPIFLDEHANCIAGLGTHGQPILHPRSIEYAAGICLWDKRIVRAEFLNDAAIARATLIAGTNSVKGAVFPAHTLHSNHHRPSRNLLRRYLFSHWSVPDAPRNPSPPAGWLIFSTIHTQQVIFLARSRQSLSIRWGRVFACEGPCLAASSACGVRRR